jgi:hypothetical protein
MTWIEWSTGRVVFVPPLYVDKPLLHFCTSRQLSTDGVGVLTASKQAMLGEKPRQHVPLATIHWIYTNFTAMID